MLVRFWGTRGSVPKAGPHTIRYGGNTSCVEVRSDQGTLLVLDCGTGAHGLGQALTVNTGQPVRGHILITHTHWDHIQGVPFFDPLFYGGNVWDIYGPSGLGASVRDPLAGQMQHTYFPVTLEQLSATVHYHDLVEGSFEIGDIRITTRYLNHPALTLGYRLEADGVVVVYATDHEPHARPLASGSGAITGEDRQHAIFLADADLVIHDAQYTAGEYAAKVGWGHSTTEYVVAVAGSVNVRQLALFHHDPLRDDDAVDRLVTDARRRADAAGARMDLFGAAEGQVIKLGRPTSKPKSPSDANVSAIAGTPHALLDQAVLIAVRDEVSAETLSDVVRADGLRLLVARDGDSFLHLARSEQPSLLILDHNLPGSDALELCRSIRHEHGPYGSDVPIVVVAGEDRHMSDPRASDAGVTDWLITPFSVTYARARIRAWLLRSACRWTRPPLPRDEPQRLGALHRLGLLDTEPEERFDRLTRLAAGMFKVPIALVSLVDEDRQWFKSCFGLNANETSREVAICAHAIVCDDMLVVPDTLLDGRFAENPLVTGDPHIRFYAGVPLSVAGGHRIGTLCLIDHRPRELDHAARRLLRDLATLVEEELARGAGGSG